MLDSIRSRFALGLAIVVLSAGSAAVCSFRTAQRIRGETGAGALHVARAFADRLSADMGARVQELESLSRLELFRGGVADRPAMRRVLTELRDHLPAGGWLGMTDAEGRVVASSSGALEDTSIAERPVFRYGRLGSWTGDLHPALRLGASLRSRPGEAIEFVDVATPVRTGEGRLRGVLALHLDWQWAAKLRETVIQTEGRPAGLRLMIVASDGPVLLGSAPGAGRESVDPELLQHRDDRWQAVRGPDGRPAIDAGATSRPFAGFKGFGWRVVARVAPEVTEARIAAATQRIWGWSLGAGIAAASVVVVWLGQRAASARSAAGTPAMPRPDRRKPLGDVHAALSKIRTTVAEWARWARPGESSPGSDALTGLPNRTALTRLARDLAADTSLGSHEFCVLCFDVDDFRDVNDRFGRSAGDKTLRDVATRIREVARADDIVLRLGGDQFVVIAPSAADTADATTEQIASRLLATMARPFEGITTSPVTLGGSIGTARWRSGGPLLVEAIARAGEALMAAKRAGRGQSRHYASRRGHGSAMAEAAARMH